MSNKLYVHVVHYHQVTRHKLVGIYYLRCIEVVQYLCDTICVSVAPLMCHLCYLESSLRHQATRKATRTACTATIKSIWVVDCRGAGNGPSALWLLQSSGDRTTATTNYHQPYAQYSGVRLESIKMSGTKYCECHVCHNIIM